MSAQTAQPTNTVGRTEQKTSIKKLAQILYGFFGAVFLIVGVSVMLLGTGLLPAAARDFVTGFGHDDPTAIHLIQEFASLLVFAGLMSFWFMKHYEHSKAFHWSLTIFWALFALAHWFDARGGFHLAVGPLINTIPFTLFLTVGLLRRGS